MKTMLSYEEALGELLARVPAPGKEKLEAGQALGRVLAEAVLADQDLPPFRKSFVDGYALRSRDVRSVPRRLKVVGMAAAGSSYPGVLQPGESVQIMTGAPVPEGADAVQMVEKTRRHSRFEVEILETVEPGEHLAPQGSEVRKGQVVLEAGRVVGPAEIGVMATFGLQEVSVWRAPRVALLATGDELVEVDQTPGFGQIRNSNAHTLWAQCRQLGLQGRVFPITRDRPEELRLRLKEALRRAELVILSGGVSMGEFDYVPGVLEELGVEVHFHRVRIKPGKPVLFGRRENRLVFGLPGNPVSAFVTFELFVRPAVARWMGFARPGLLRVRGILLQEVRQKPGRKFFMPAQTTWKDESFRVRPLETMGSADLVGFSAANSLLEVPAEVSCLKKGERVFVRLLGDFLRKEGS